MNVEGIDHIVLTVTDIDTTCAFYTKVLGMHITTFGANRKALSSGSQKINLHQYGREFEPKAKRPTPGSEDLCFFTDVPITQLLEHLGACAVGSWRALSRVPVRWVPSFRCTFVTRTEIWSKCQTIQAHKK